MRLLATSAIFILVSFSFAFGEKTDLLTLAGGATVVNASSNKERALDLKKG